jgi:hypothetical protein
MASITKYTDCLTLSKLVNSEAPIPTTVRICLVEGVLIKWTLKARSGAARMKDMVERV